MELYGVEGIGLGLIGLIGFGRGSKDEMGLEGI